MFASSAIQITHQAPGSLQIAIPPYYSTALWLVVLGLFMAGLSMVGTKRAGAYKFALAVLLPFVLAAIGVLTSHSAMVLSRDTGQMVIDRWFCGVHMATREISLSSIRSVNMETDRGSRSLVLILQSGGVVRLSSFTPRPGQYAVQNAIQDFLAGR